MSTASALHALCCGRLTFARHLFFPGESPEPIMTVPVPSWLVAHRKGLLLFDTGIACGAADDPPKVLGEQVAKTFRLTGAADENLLDQLARHGLAPRDVTHVACSHLHFDHCGCNALFPHARILVQRAEHDSALDPANRYDRRLVEQPLDYQFLDSEHDVFGDGSAMLVPTPGHTAGHQSCIVRTARDRRFFLAADACYSQEHLERDVLPGTVWNADAMRASMDLLRNWRARSDIELMFGHDARQWERLEATGQRLS